MQNLIRPAKLEELESLNALIQESAQHLSQGYYTQTEIDSLNQFVFGADSDLIADQTYYAIERDGEIVACGGWSRRATLFGGDRYQKRDTSYLDPNKDAAKIRAFFIHPKCARQGLASMLLQHCEQAAKKFGFKKMELMSTMPGIDFYASQGFKGDKLVSLTIENGVTVQLKPMIKEI